MPQSACPSTHAPPPNARARTHAQGPFQSLEPSAEAGGRDAAAPKTRAPPPGPPIDSAPNPKNQCMRASPRRCANKKSTRRRCAPRQYPGVTAPLLPTPTPSSPQPACLPGRTSPPPPIARATARACTLGAVGTQPAGVGVCPCPSWCAPLAAPYRISLNPSRPRPRPPNLWARRHKRNSATRPFLPALCQGGRGSGRLALF
ncbi:MAG: hypothetical protein J3K34DRAFT_399782 [Monoraphidium minutum]|nr:MAG: hypothetical protein J3K34DRAFT_399782 [Monoraphidium minutum]